jgi:hypothetical protein
MRLRVAKEREKGRCPDALPDVIHLFFYIPARFPVEFFLVSEKERTKIEQY